MVRIDMWDAADSALADLRLALGPCVPPDLQVTYDLRLDMGSRAAMTTKLGRRRYRVSLNPHFMLCAGLDKSLEVLHHEVAHVIDDAVLGWRHGKLHGRSWRFLMRLLGYHSPQPCHTVTPQQMLVSNQHPLLGPRCEDARLNALRRNPDNDVRYGGAA